MILVKMFAMGILLSSLGIGAEEGMRIVESTQSESEWTYHIESSDGDRVVETFDVRIEKEGLARRMETRAFTDIVVDAGDLVLSDVVLVPPVGRDAWSLLFRVGSPFGQAEGFELPHYWGASAPVGVACNFGVDLSTAPSSLADSLHCSPGVIYDDRSDEYVAARLRGFVDVEHTVFEEEHRGLGGLLQRPVRVVAGLADSC